MVAASIEATKPRNPSD